MSSRVTGKNFFEQHWDWLVAGAGVLAAVASYAFNFVLCEEEEEISFAAGVSAKVDKVDMSTYTSVSEAFAKPGELAELDDTAETANFLASGLRVFCAPVDAKKKSCGRAIPFGLEECPGCHAAQKMDEKPTDDHDDDGLPDDYEKQYGLDPLNKDDADLDKDGDGYTNREEYEAKTDPTDPKSHLDYLTDDRVRIASHEAKPLRLTFTKFKYRANGKDILEFYNPDFEKDYCKGILSVAVGDEIMVNDPKKGVLKTGFILKSYEKRDKEVVIAGGSKTREDASVAVVERIKDKKAIVLQLPPRGKKIRETPMDISLKIEIAGLTKEPIAVTEGDPIALPEFGVAYKVDSVREGEVGGNKRLTVKILNETTGESKMLMSN